MPTLSEDRKDQIDAMVEILRYTWYCNPTMNLGALVAEAGLAGSESKPLADQSDQELSGGFGNVAMAGTIAEAEARNAGDPS
jgi:hypothetical protein